MSFGFVYDERMLEHDCPYDATMAERPERMKLIYERLQQDGLLDDAVQIAAREATDAELLRNHPEDLLKELAQLESAEDCEEFCKDKEILWLAPASENAARLAAGSSIDLVKANCEGSISNGFAIIRPPGHHSYGRLPQGYCVFNNVAIAAKAAVEDFGVKKVAVVDFDYHPGNGTFHSLKDDDRFMFFSIHAYHQAAFWPFTSEFDYDTKRNQIFFPLNGAMNTEADYIGVFNNVLCPILKEWEPELILISAGFDAGYYDIMMETGQAVKAHGFGHMARLLNEITPGRVLALLEGGYFAKNYTESAAMMVRGLKGDPLPVVDFPSRLSASMVETILCNVIHHSRRFKRMEQKWAELKELQKSHGLAEFVVPEKIDLGKAVRRMWDEVKENRAVRTREWFPEMTEEQVELCTRKIDQYIQAYRYGSSPTPSTTELNAQLVWDDTAKAECFIQKAQACFWFHTDYTDFRDGKKDHMMICDRALYNFDEKKKLD